MMRTLIGLSLMAIACLDLTHSAETDDNSYLDVYFKVHSTDGLFDASQESISYYISVLGVQKHFDLQNVALNIRRIYRNEKTFEDSTVVGLTKELLNIKGKSYLGFKLFGLPAHIQDYVIVEVSELIHNGIPVRSTFSSNGVDFSVEIFKKKEVILGGAIPYGINMDDDDNTTSSNTTQKHCSCIDYDCGCCERAIIRKINLDDNVCVNVSYISADIGLEISLSVNNQTYFASEISATNPPAICFDLPYLHGIASLCVRLHDLHVNTNEDGNEFLVGCSDVEVHVLHQAIAVIQTGCFRIRI